MNREIRILFVEDVQTDFELIKRSIRKNEISFIENNVQDKEEYIRELKEFDPDIILSDYTLPQFSGLLALQLRNEISPQTPFILVTGSNNEEVAVECMKAGADDYILKNNMTRLSSAINAAIEKYDYLKSKKQAEDLLFESEQLFRTAFENAAIGVCMIDSLGRFMNINSTFCEMIGYTKDEMIHKSLTDITHPDDKTISLDKLGQIKPNETLNFEKRYLHKTGHIIWANLFTSRVFSPKSNSYYFVTYVQNITDRKEFEGELIRAKLKAEESDCLKSAFLQNISHEIRTPMNAIVGFAGFLKDPDLPDVKLKYYTDIIINSSNQLLSIITDIITIATIEAGQEKLNLSEIKLNTLIRLIYAQFQNTAESKGLSLSFETGLEDHGDRIMADETRLESIMSNLVGNAVKFTLNGLVKFGYKIKDQSIEFSVIDTGIGISEEFHEEVFKRFRQVESNNNRRFGGSGLGLSISKAYVELMGGKIWLESQENSGTSFYFTIPYTQVSEQKGTMNLPLSLFNKKLNILVTEDEESNYLLLREMLDGSEINLLKAVNGNEAVQICKKNPDLDVVLMDIKMPVMDGIVATQQIKKIRPDLPVIIQSAYSLPNDRKLAFDSGCDHFLSKPINRNELIRSLNQILSHKNSKLAE